MDNKKLLIGALLIGGIAYLWWRKKSKGAVMGASDDAETESGAGGGAGVGGSTATSSGDISVPTDKTTYIKRPLFADRIKDRIQSGGITLGGSQPVGKPMLDVTPSYKPMPSYKPKPTTFNIQPTLATNTSVKSSFLTFDGKYQPASRHYFDGNLD